MPLLILSLGVFAVTGLLSVSAGRSHRRAALFGAGGAVAACLMGLVPAVRAMTGGPVESFDLAWSLPGGSVALGLDSLSGFFLVLVLGVGAAAAVFGSEYLQPSSARPSVGSGWLMFNLLLASMAIVVTARNAVAFLVAWEIMTLASFLLVMWEDTAESTRRAGWTYLVMAHLGTACLIGFFAGLSRGGGLMEFGAGAPPSGALAGWLFLLSLIGFGTKAGLVPLHVWLPEAHPAAPSHVSAVMSGVMVKLGLYGILRALMLLGPAPAGWGAVLLAAGLISGVFGALQSLAQRDLKRVLAYSTIEHMGIITMALGLGIVTGARGHPAAAALAFSGALLHAFVHAAGKTLLFLATGSVAHATGTRNLERLGGLLPRMPVTGPGWLIGALTLAGLPPFAGCLGEFLIGFGALSIMPTGRGLVLVAATVTLAGLALIAGLAAAGFLRAFGLGFLGVARSPDVEHAHEPGPAMRWPVTALATGCAFGGLAAPWLARVPTAAAAMFAGGDASGDTVVPLAAIAGLGGVLLGLAAWLWWLRGRLPAGRPAASVVTWDCGYAAPSATMQYTASSFAQPLLAVFGPVAVVPSRGTPVAGLFPGASERATADADPVADRLLHPVLVRAEGWLGRMRVIQGGRVQQYVGYLAAALVFLLLWESRQ